MGRSTKVTAGSRTPWWLVVSIPVLLALVAGCGEDTAKASDEKSLENRATLSTPDTSTGEGLPDWPACADVWVAGAKLPRRYAGCLDQEGTVKAETQQCSSGQVMVTHDERYYAFLGEPVNETEGLDDDADYRSARNACLG